MCLCVVSRLGQRERWLKIDVGPRMDGRQKLGERWQLKGRGRCNSCLNGLVDETSNSPLAEPLIPNPSDFDTQTHHPSPAPASFQATDEICFSSLSSPSASPSPISGCLFFSSRWYLAISEA